MSVAGYDGHGVAHRAGGNFWLTAGFALGSLVLAGVLLVKGRFFWSWVESLIAALVVVCLVIWLLSGPKVATVATTVAIVIAGVPGMIELWRSPQRAQALVWAGYTAANLLALGAAPPGVSRSVSRPPCSRCRPWG